MELREEAGIEARSWTSLGRCHTSNCWTDEVAHLFLARDLVQGAAQPGGDEEIATRRVPLAEAQDRLRSLLEAKWDASVGSPSGANAA